MGGGVRREGRSGVETQALDCNEELRRERRTIVFAGESGITPQPHRVPACAPRGEKKVFHQCFKWNTPSAVAEVTSWSTCFRHHPWAIRGPQLVECFDTLRRQARGPAL